MNSRSPSASRRFFTVYYFLTAFFVAFALLVIEIVAARLIAPYVGVSLYTWSAVIGIILAGLSLGNWLGGMWAEKKAAETATGFALLAAGVLTFMSLPMLEPVAFWLSAQTVGTLASSVLYTGALFLLPAIVLGLIPPILIIGAVKRSAHPGWVVGGMQAVGALGGIAGVFLSGFWLIQHFGSKTVIFATACGLLALSVPYLFKRHSSFVLLPTALVLMLALVDLSAMPPRCDRESNYYCISVVDRTDEMFEGEASGLVLDHLLHGINHKSQPELLLAAFAHGIEEILHAHFKRFGEGPRDYFFAGGGSYTLPRAIRAADPAAGISVAEIDAAVTAVSAQSLYVNPRDFSIVHEDARRALLTSQAKYDAVVADVFHDIAVPYHLLTNEFFGLVKSRLNENGIYLMNIVDYYPDAKLVKSVVNTLRESFRYVNVWMDHAPASPTRFTYVISAADNHFPEDTVAARKGMDRAWLRVNALLESVGSSIAETPVLTDDYVPVERLIGKLLSEAAP